MRIRIELTIALVGFLLLGTMAVIMTQTRESALKEILINIDGSILAVRQGNSDGAKNSLQRARSGYQELNVGRVNDGLDNEVKKLFELNENSPSEEKIHALRKQVLAAAGAAGSFLPSIYSYAMVLVLAVSAFFALFVTLITKRIVNWDRIKKVKAEFQAWQKELLSAQRKHDMKRVHKLQQEQSKMYALQSEIMGASLKPMLFYLVPYFLLWWQLGSIYAGWVLAWLPFGISLPFIGFWTSCGFLSWFIITYFGFSSILRKIIIGD